MIYTQNLLDRKTGELTIIEMGDWITITELGQLYEAGPRRTRSILRHLGFLQVEGGGRQQRHRLCQWVIDRGWGKRVQARQTVPFDVIGPEARKWVDERWTNAVAELDGIQSGPTVIARDALTAFREQRNHFRRSHGHDDMDIPEMVSWLNDHHPALSHSDIGSILDVSQQLVSRYLGERSRERALRLEMRHAPLEVKPRVVTGVRLDQL